VILDHAVIAELRALGDPDVDLLADVVRAFLDDAPRQLLALGAALDACDAGAIERLAHRLRGSALSVGASQFAARCGDTELAGRHGDLAGAAAAAGGLQSDFETARDALERELG
jgi:HPt (histidine-containing phosphotransfer) domain-containing protein